MALSNTTRRRRDSWHPMLAFAKQSKLDDPTLPALPREVAAHYHLRSTPSSFYVIAASCDLLCRFLRSDTLRLIKVKLLVSRLLRSVKLVQRQVRAHLARRNAALAVAHNRLVAACASRGLVADIDVEMEVVQHAYIKWRRSWHTRWLASHRPERRQRGLSLTQNKLHRLIYRPPSALVSTAAVTGGSQTRGAWRFVLDPASQSAALLSEYTTKIDVAAKDDMALTVSMLLNEAPSLFWQHSIDGSDSKRSVVQQQSGSGLLPGTHSAFQQQLRVWGPIRQRWHSGGTSVCLRWPARWSSVDHFYLVARRLRAAVIKAKIEVVRKTTRVADIGLDERSLGEAPREEVYTEGRLLLASPSVPANRRRRSRSRSPSVVFTDDQSQSLRRALFGQQQPTTTTQPGSPRLGETGENCDCAVPASNPGDYADNGAPVTNQSSSWTPQQCAVPLSDASSPQEQKAAEVVERELLRREASDPPRCGLLDLLLLERRKGPREPHPTHQRLEPLPRDVSTAAARYRLTLHRRPAALVELKATRPSSAQLASLGSVRRRSDRLAARTPCPTVTTPPPTLDQLRLDAQRNDAALVAAGQRMQSACLESIDVTFGALKMPALLDKLRSGEPLLDSHATPELTCPPTHRAAGSTKRSTFTSPVAASKSEADDVVALWNRRLRPRTLDRPTEHEVSESDAVASEAMLRQMQAWCESADARRGNRLGFCRRAVV